MFSARGQNWLKGVWDEREEVNKTQHRRQPEAAYEEVSQWSWYRNWWWVGEKRDFPLPKPQRSQSESTITLEYRSKLRENTRTLNFSGRRRKIIKQSDAREQLEWNRKQNGWRTRERRKGKVFRFYHPMRWSKKKFNQPSQCVDKNRPEQKALQKFFGMDNVFVTLRQPDC